MFVVGIDVGTRNLGMCIIQQGHPLSPKPIRLFRWVNVDIVPTAKNINKVDMARLISCAVDQVWDILEEARILSGGELSVAIERQPNCNPRMKALGASIFSASYVFTKLNQNSRVCYVSPGKKFLVSKSSCVNRSSLSPKATTRARYVANKKDGVLTCRMLLDTERVEFFGETAALGREIFDNSRKKDDLADSLLVALSYLKVELP
jgi:hypothetical protein